MTCEFKEWTFVPGVRSSLRKDGSVQGDNGDDADSSLVSPPVFHESVDH